MEDDPLDYSSRWFLKIVSVAVAGLCFYARLATGAYLFLLMFPSYLVVCIVHCIFHFQALKLSIPLSRQMAKRLFISHFFFVIAFMFQYDYTDGPEWLTITILVFGQEKGGYDFGYDSWKSSLTGWMGVVLSVFVFIPVVISWKRLRKSKEAINENEANPA
jgi:hypothetical protein